MSSMSRAEWNINVGEGESLGTQPQPDIRLTSSKDPTIVLWEPVLTHR
jgi:hypothetical protein